MYGTHVTFLHDIIGQMYCTCVHRLWAFLCRGGRGAHRYILPVVVSINNLRKLEEKKSLSLISASCLYCVVFLHCRLVTVCTTWKLLGEL